ncbi:hypothetical protein IscW_ISCW008292 [Ixodes scapularis]|uniref:Uncharacterized protein n=1 Tax=Ixodes scapularis TaxID=6945 RepID=B7PUS0_IXOSC|nr:hypothetical protein IscW_ISCW008292 [Ixodes scapularis]|eukprot:XP_002406690.1 hypothetical protein IscW_ISCW008292 [Ixodes scapularis]
MFSSVMLSPSPFFLMYVFSSLFFCCKDFHFFHFVLERSRRYGIAQDKEFWNDRFTC